MLSLDYRHRFEQSPNFRALRWSLGNLGDKSECELCELGAPLVSRFPIRISNAFNLYRFDYFWN